MTLTIELAPETEITVEEEARRRGVPVATVAAEALRAWAEDVADNAAADRALAEGGDPIPWEVVEAELGL